MAKKTITSSTQELQEFNKASAELVSVLNDLAKALGIVYTLHLSEHGPTLEPEIRVYYDPDSGYTYHVAYLCRGKYVINLIEAEVVNKEQINQRLKLKHCYTASDLKLEQY